MRFRAEDLRLREWAPPQTLHITNCCGARRSTWRSPMALAGGNSCIWDSGTTANTVRARSAALNGCDDPSDPLPPIEARLATLEFIEGCHRSTNWAQLRNLKHGG
jgi:hypothetical protein